MDREVVDFENPWFCKRCGRRWGDHLTEAALEKNLKACQFVPKEGNSEYGILNRPQRAKEIR